MLITETNVDHIGNSFASAITDLCAEAINMRYDSVNLVDDILKAFIGVELTVKYSNEAIELDDMPPTATYLIFASCDKASTELVYFNREWQTRFKVQKIVRVTSAGSTFASRIATANAIAAQMAYMQLESFEKIVEDEMFRELGGE